MPASGFLANSSAWQYTPNSGSAILLGKMKDWSYDEGISRVQDGGDYDAFPTVNLCDWQNPTLTLSTFGVFNLKLVSPATVGVVTGKVHDSFSGITAGGGGHTITLSNASLMTRSGSGSHRQIARGQLAFCAYSMDGVTSPLAIAAL